MATISELLLLPGNDSCADCNVSNPRWASCSFGVFVCDSCAKVHRTLERPESQRTHLGNALIGRNDMMATDLFMAQSNVPNSDDGGRLPAVLGIQNIDSARSTAPSASNGKYGYGCEKHVVIHVTSPSLTNNPHLIQALTMVGNNAAKRHYESLVPVSYRRPVATCPRVLREEWIRSKYERQEFTVESNAKPDGKLPSPSGSCTALLTGNLAGGRRPCDSYQSGYKEGYLWKRKREDKKFNRRWFVLDQIENTLRYYNHDKIHEPKGTWRIDYINAVILPEKIGHPYGMQLTYNNPGGPTRNIYVNTTSGKELIEWYSCLRWVKLKRLLIMNPLQSPDELAPVLTRDFVKEGWLSKTGPKPTAGYRRRWFTLDGRRLQYFKEPLEAVARGEICLGTRDQGFYLIDSNGVEISDAMLVQSANTGTPLISVAVPTSADLAFSLETPCRCYRFLAGNVDEKIAWIRVLHELVDPVDQNIVRSTARLS